MVRESDSGIDCEESVHALNKVSQMLGEDLTSFQQAVGDENVNRILTKQEIDEAKAKTTDPEAVSYMDSHALEFENASTWEGIAIGHPWRPYAVVLQPTNDGSLDKCQIFRFKGGCCSHR